MIDSNIQKILDILLNSREGGSKIQSDSDDDVYHQFPEDSEDASQLNDLFETVSELENSSQVDNHLELLLKHKEFSETNTFVKRHPYIQIIQKVAAILLPFFIISTLAFIFLILRDNDRNQVITTLRGSKTSVLLEDGTLVWLNSESTLTYPSTFRNKDKRIVRLSGEAFFDVTHNKKKPFEVFVDGFKVNVLGTSFNVKAYPDEDLIETTLEEGLVNIEKLPDDAGSAISKRIITLKPNETLVLYKNGMVKNNMPNLPAKENDKAQVNVSSDNQLHKQNAILVENVDLSPYVAWKENKLVFKSKPLEDIVVDLERWYNISITIENSALKDITCTATFTNETAEQAVHAICVAAKIDYVFEKNHVIIKSMN